MLKLGLLCMIAARGGGAQEAARRQIGGGVFLKCGINILGVCMYDGLME